MKSERQPVVENNYTTVGAYGIQQILESSCGAASMIDACDDLYFAIMDKIR